MIGAAPVLAHLFDGHSARRNRVAVSISRDGRGLVIAEPADSETPGGTPWVWPLDRLRLLPDQADVEGLTLTLHSDTDDESPRDLARLVITHPALVAWIHESAPDLRKRDLRSGTARKIITRLGLAVVSIVVFVFVILPGFSNYLAQNMPRETEVRLGKTVLAQIAYFLGEDDESDFTCRSEAGDAALASIVSRLTAGQGLDYDIQVAVFDHEMVNAFAAPGGQIVLLNGLLAEAETPEEVAAVLGHEIGHVEARDPLRLMLRAAGMAGIVSVIIGDVSGGAAIGIIAEQIVQMSSSREAESRADDFSLELLSRARISTTALADFFDTLSEVTGGVSLPEYLSSHPATPDRAARARDYARGQGVTLSLLTEEEWNALKTICAR